MESPFPYPLQTNGPVGPGFETVENYLMRRKLLSSTFLWCYLQGDSVGENLKCDHSNENY